MDEIGVFEGNFDEVDSTYVSGLWMCDCRAGDGAIHYLTTPYCDRCGCDVENGGMPLLVEVIAEWALGYLELDTFDVIDLLDALAKRVVDGRIE